MATIENRSTIRIRPQVAELSRRLPELEPASIIKFARGSHILDRYRPILNNAGLQLFERVSKGSLSVPFIEDIIPELPSTAVPRLELYRHPFETVSGRAYENFIKSLEGNSGYPGLWMGILDLATGCYHQCIMCGADSSISARFMTYPSFLKLLTLLPEYAAPGLILYDASDPLLWRDTEHDADFGDLMSCAKHQGYELFPRSTNGIITGDPFSTEAARKLGEAGLSIGLSIHLYQRKNLEDGPEIELEMLANRYAETINLLRSVRIKLRSAGSPEHVRSFFLDRVLPKLDPELRAFYDDPKNFSLERVYVDGRAAEEPSFERGLRHSISVPRDKAEGWVEDNPAVYSTVDALGNCFLSVFPPDRSSAHLVRQSLVKELFPSRDEEGFKRLLLKVIYVLRNDRTLHNRRDLTLKFWEEYADCFDPVGFLGLFSGIGSLAGFTGELLSEAYDMIGPLGVVSPAFYYDWTIGDLCRKLGNTNLNDVSRAEDGFFRYLSNLRCRYNGRRDESGFLGSFDEGRWALESMSFEALSPLPTISAFEFDPSLPAPKMRFPLPFRAQTGL